MAGLGTMPGNFTSNAGDHLHTDAMTRTVYSTDNSIYQIEPHAVALPKSDKDIRHLIESNARQASPRAIVARGGGTGTNGQSLTDGIMVDVKRHLNRIIEIDPIARTAIVQPGVVTASLNAVLAADGLFWAPHTSTLNRATVGGMISTDAAGKGSLVHGRAHRHVLALDVLLDDGTPCRLEPTLVDDARRLAEQPGRVGDLWTKLLNLPVQPDQDFGLPELARGFSGYGIDRLHRKDESGRHIIDPISLVCGAEGTLAFITQATIRLTPLPTHTMLFVASYDTFADALDDAVDLRATHPTAIESFDETTLERGRSSPAWPALGAVVGDHRGSVLLIEYSGETAPDEAAVEAALAATGRSLAVRATVDPTERAAAWKVRADAVGLLAKVATGGPRLSARPTAFVEDCAVPVANMGAFIADFRAALDGFGLEYAMFGHADVGCVHVRPALDLADPEHESMVRKVTDQVVAILQRHGGVLWGEHGRGFRGESAATFLTESTIAIMRQVKDAFDPRDLFNPGKLYRPLGTDEPIVAIDDAALRGHANRAVPVTLRTEFDHAFACNGNGLCHHYDGAEVMCPSYKATGDPALSPKGRADLVRAWLAMGDTPDPEFEDAIAANLHECLSCSACTGHCPVEVDIPELKSQFLDRYYRNRKRPLSHHVLSRFETMATLAARAPRIAAFGSAPFGAAVGLVDLPAPQPAASRTRKGAPHLLNSGDFQRGNFKSGDFDVVIMPDVFTSALEPATLHKTVDVLVGLGYRTAVAPFVPSGKFDHVKGKRDAFAKASSDVAAMVDRIKNSGAVPVVIEPAVALLHDHEYPAINPGFPRGAARAAVELIDERRDRLQRAATPTEVHLLGHCTERATAPAALAAWQRVLTSAGHRVVAPDLGCCGMAGIFGHEKANQAMSRTLWEQSWKPALSQTSEACATGYSCRSQVKRFGNSTVPHPIHKL